MADAAPSPFASLVRQSLDDPRARSCSDQELLRRFLAARDEAAFDALLRRHGPMVLDVCRGVLAREADAEDAFQATFLVLASKAASIRKAASLASWLHGVACRVARKARAESARRHRHESRVPQDRPAARTGDDLTWREVRQAVHEELGGLSDRYRSPLVLCYLEGKTQDEAARLLGLPKGTLKGYLERGRALLRARLVRRGFGAAALLAAAWPAASLGASVPATLAGSTLKAAAFVAAQGVVTTAASVNVAALTEGVLKAMFLTKLKVVTAAFVAVGALATGILSLPIAGPGGSEARASDPPAGKKKPAKEKELTDLEKKLVGRWVGTRGFVVPTLTLSADRTFRETIASETSEGTWTLKEGELPPTLVRRYTKSDDKRLAGTSTKTKVVGLDDSSLSFPNADDALRTITYRRSQAEPPPAVGNPAPGKAADEERPERQEKQVDLEKRLVGTWVGHTERHGESYTFRSDGTFKQVSVVQVQKTEEGTWVFDWGTLPPTLVLKVTKSDTREAPVGTVFKHKVARLDDKRLAFENPNRDQLGWGEPRPITYTRAKETPAGDKPAQKGEPGDRTPRRADLLGKWYGDDNGLAQVLFTLDLKDDATFVLERRDTAPKFEATTHGAWELDGDRPAVILRGKRWVEDGKPVGGRKEQTESLAVSRKDSKWLLTHPLHGKYVRHEAAEEMGRPARRGPDDR